MNFNFMTAAAVDSQKPKPLASSAAKNILGTMTASLDAKSTNFRSLDRVGTESELASKRPSEFLRKVDMRDNRGQPKKQFVKREAVSMALSVHNPVLATIAMPGGFSAAASIVSASASKSNTAKRQRVFIDRVRKIKKAVKRERYKAGEEFSDSSDDSLVRFDMPGPNGKAPKKPIENKLQKFWSPEQVEVSQNIFADKQIAGMLSQENWARNWGHSNHLERSRESLDYDRFRSALLNSI